MSVCVRPAACVCVRLDACASYSHYSITQRDFLIHSFRKTEKITKKIQDLLVAAQEGRCNDYAPAADKICYAVTDMRSLFPENPNRETIRSALALLQVIRLGDYQFRIGAATGKSLFYSRVV